MKGFIAILGLFFSIFFLSAQEHTQQTSVSLNIVLRPVLNLTVNPQQMTTTLAYNTLEDYRNGVEVINKEHLTVSATGPYEVNVQFIQPEFLQTTGQVEKTMYLPQIKVTAIPIEPDGGIQLQTATITTENQSIISSSSPILNKVFDVSYRGPGEEYFLDYISSTEAAQFSNTVLYSIETR
ncbi:hypothetical protein [Sphingobacterium wenxiniae]|uniref:Uncharacterized protein n=1 Tax=Sphingobacterium wenxiniae TaxID=683125 RepID=A0A1I6R8N1_9SPHI|nr:hypothetical protein [Sphingobacterium wenxiniae]SFS61063.1 hypothetical protein SAMN05660206_103204 [Sphingobacterium wenxiniae]